MDPKVKDTWWCVLIFTQREFSMVVCVIRPLPPLCNGSMLISPVNLE